MRADTISNESFSKLVCQYLEYHTPLDLACHCEVAVSTINRWAVGLAYPLSGVMQFVANYIDKIRQEEEW